MSLYIGQNLLAQELPTAFTSFEGNIVARAARDTPIATGGPQTAPAPSQQSLLALQQSVYNKVGVALQSLQSVAQSFSSMASLLPPTATTSAPDTLAAAAGAQAQPGSYSIVVNTLAQAQSNYSEAFASATQAGLLTPGALSIAVAGNNPISFNIDNTTTLQSLTDAINESGLGVQATIINDDSGARLSVTGRDTGASNTLTLTDAGTGLNLENHQEQSAQDASIQINNSLTISSPSNTISGAISGVTLQIVGQSAAPTIISVQANSQSLAADVQNLVSNYNSVITDINQAAVFDGSYDPTSLIGDPTFNNLRGQLQATLGAAAPTAKGSFSALAQLGVMTQEDGTLSLNAAQLQSAINTDPQSVAALLANSADGTQLGAAGQLAAVARDYGAPSTGILAQQSQGIAEQMQQATYQLADVQNAMTTYQNTLRQQFVGLNESIVALQLQNELTASLDGQAGDVSSSIHAAEPAAPDFLLAGPVADNLFSDANGPIPPSLRAQGNLS